LRGHALAHLLHLRPAGAVVALTAELRLHLRRGLQAQRHLLLDRNVNVLLLARDGIEDLRPKVADQGDHRDHNRDENSPGEEGAAASGRASGIHGHLLDRLTPVHPLPLEE
jgi:hypothetical protein